MNLITVAVNHQVKCLMLDACIAAYGAGQYLTQLGPLACLKSGAKNGRPICRNPANITFVELDCL
jgi:hypothetical protein